MRRKRGEIPDLLARLGREVPPPSEHDLRAMARTASSRARSLPRPIPTRRWPLQAGWTGVLVVALVVAVGLGVGLGALIAPSGTAALGPIGTGFLPGPGWTVLQTGSDATPERQALAVATNVPLHPEDSARGIRNSSGLPYSTLLQLPPRGVVIVALFTRRESEPWNDEHFPERELPLRVREAMKSISYSYQVRPDRPLGQYELRVRVGDHYVVVHFYFGSAHPSPQLIAAAQRQLDRLIVASASAATVRAQAEGRAAIALGVGLVVGAPAFSFNSSADAQPTASRLVDRTLVCPVAPGGMREIDVNAQSGTRLFGDLSKWKFRPSASFGDPRSATPTAPHVSAGIVAGWPPTSEPGRPPDPDSLAYSVRCRSTSARVRLSATGLSGGQASPLGDEYDCGVPSKVVVRIRAVFRDPTSIRRERTRFVDQFVARGPVRESYIAIRTLSGKRIALASVHESGMARIFVGDTCEKSG